MAQVPNYYYQSPWIADAARNLASALAPPDPEKELAKQRAQWQFERSQELALRQDQQYKDTQDAEEAFADMLRPVVNPLTGAVDQQLTNEKIMSRWSDAIQLGGDPSIGESLSGELNPEVAVKRAMAKLKAAEAMGLAGFNWNQRGALQDDAQAATAAENEKNRRFQAEQNALRLKAHLQRTKGQGGPNEIPDAIIKTISYGLDDRIAATGRDMSLEDYFRFGEEAGKRWQVNGNVDQAINEVWAETFANSRTFADAEHEADLPGLFGGTKGKLKPHFADRPVPARDLASPLTETPAPAEAPTPAPVTRTTPAAAPTPAKSPTSSVATKTPPVKALKEGVITTFKNGEKWTLKNGVPTKVK
jgi:hypothetical protein